MTENKISPEQRAKFAKQLNLPDNPKNLYIHLEFDAHPNDPDPKNTKILMCLGEYGLHFRRTGYFEQNAYNEKLGMETTLMGNMDFTGSIIRDTVNFIVVNHVYESDGKFDVDVFYGDGGALKIGPMTEPDAFMLRNQIWGWRITEPQKVQQFIFGIPSGPVVDTILQKEPASSTQIEDNTPKSPPEDEKEGKDD